jgi:hypothetical protein
MACVIQGSTLEGQISIGEVGGGTPECLGGFLGSSGSLGSLGRDSCGRSPIRAFDAWMPGDLPRRTGAGRHAISTLSILKGLGQRWAKIIARDLESVEVP